MSAILTASLASVAHARIVGFGVPETIKAGDTFDAIILSENYIQSVTDVVIAFGYSPGVAPAESLGNFISASDLGKSLWEDPWIRIPIVMLTHILV